MLKMMIYIFITLFGLVFGSFSSVIIHRLHSQKKGILFGRSFCPHCSKQLEAKDLIPILSYLLNRGKCRFCKKKISAFYPILELSMASIFLLTSILVGTENWIQLIFYLFISFIFIILTFYDFLYKEIPDQISLPAIIITILFAVIDQSFSTKNLIIGILIPTLFFGSLFFSSKGRWLGGGDIRIGALMGALVGFPMILTVLFFAYLSGSVFSLFGLIIKKFNRKTQIPFAPFLLLGTYITLFWGKDIMTWYIQLL